MGHLRAHADLAQPERERAAEQAREGQQYDQPEAARNDDEVVGLALAEAIPRGGPNDSRVRIATYQEGQVYRISTRLRTVTLVELGDGESFVIGGLVSRTTTSSVDKVPLLGDLPVLGTMFKRQDYQQNERELVIVVTPHLVKPFAQGTQVDAALPGRAEQRDPAFWRGFVVGNGADDALPGFSR